MADFDLTPYGPTHDIAGRLTSYGKDREIARLEADLAKARQDIARMSTWTPPDGEDRCLEKTASRGTDPAQQRKDVPDVS